MAKIEFPEGFAEVLKALCESYDMKYDEYVESRYERKAIREYYYEIQGEET